MSKLEYTSKRDAHYSQWHRTAPNRFYMQDIDSVEYDKHGNPVAINEIKHGQTKYINFDSFQFKCHRQLAKIAQVPFFCIVAYHYDAEGFILDANDMGNIDRSQFYVIPDNPLANQLMYRPTLLSEKQYIKLLGELRNEKLYDNELSIYSDWTLPEERLPTLQNYEDQ